MKRKKRTAIPELSVDAQMLIKRLRELEPGDVVPYDELSALIHKDVTHGQGYGLLATARRRLLNDDAIVLESVRKTGVKRLRNDEITSCGEQTLSRVRKAVRRGLKKLATVHYDELSNGAKQSHNVASAHLGALALVLKPRMRALLEQRQQATVEKLDARQTLEMFMKN